MKLVVQALVNTLRSLEAWEEPIDNDGILKIEEDVATTLLQSTPQEIEELRAILNQLAEEELAAGDRWNIVEFYRNFLFMVGIDEEPSPETGN